MNINRSNSAIVSDIKHHSISNKSEGKLGDKNISLGQAGDARAINNEAKLTNSATHQKERSWTQGQDNLLPRTAQSNNASQGDLTDRMTMLLSEFKPHSLQESMHLSFPQVQIVTSKDISVEPQMSGVPSKVPNEKEALQSAAKETMNTVKNMLDQLDQPKTPSTGKPISAKAVKISTAQAQTAITQDVTATKQMAQKQLPSLNLGDTNPSPKKAALEQTAKDSMNALSNMLDGIKGDVEQQSSRKTVKTDGPSSQTATSQPVAGKKQLPTLDLGDTKPTPQKADLQKAAKDTMDALSNMLDGIKGDIKQQTSSKTVKTDGPSSQTATSQPVAGKKQLPTLNLGDTKPSPHKADLEKAAKDTMDALSNMLDGIKGDVEQQSSRKTVKTDGPSSQTATSQPVAGKKQLPTLNLGDTKPTPQKADLQKAAQDTMRALSNMASTVLNAPKAQKGTDEIDGPSSQTATSQPVAGKKQLPTLNLGDTKPSPKKADLEQAAKDTMDALSNMLDTVLNAPKAQKSTDEIDGQRITIDTPDTPDIKPEPQKPGNDEVDGQRTPTSPSNETDSTKNIDTQKTTTTSKTETDLGRANLLVGFEVEFSEKYQVKFAYTTPGERQTVLNSLEQIAQSAEGKRILQEFGEKGLTMAPMATLLAKNNITREEMSERGEALFMAFHSTSTPPSREYVIGVNVKPTLYNEANVLAGLRSMLATVNENIREHTNNVQTTTTTTTTTINTNSSDTPRGPTDAERRAEDQKIERQRAPRNRGRG